MKPSDLKKRVKEKGIRLLDLANAIGCSYSYLTHLLNGYSPLKEEWEKKILEEIDK